MICFRSLISKNGYYVLWPRVEDDTFVFLLAMFLIDTSVPDPKLIISEPDPDPQIENQEFRIRILDSDPSVNK